MPMRPIQYGVLVPWVNTAMEEELPGLVSPRIGLHWSRMRPATVPRDGHDTSYLDGMRDALVLALSGFDGLFLNGLVIGCTSLSVACTKLPISSLGGARRALPVITAFNAILERLEKVRATRVLLLAPYDNLSYAQLRLAV